jgi:hypothetical protein
VRLITIVSLPSLAVLALMGGLAARAGGAKVMIGVMRGKFWGLSANGDDCRHQVVSWGNCVTSAESGRLFQRWISFCIT